MTGKSESTYTMTDVVVVGSGVTGLTTALRCQQAGLVVKVLEAAQRVGGRIHSVYSATNQPDSYLADLGPTWVWPPYQASVQRAVAELDLQLVEQYNNGPAMVERPGGQAPEQHHLPGQHGMSRLRGGPQSIVNALVDKLNENTIATGQKVISLADKQDHIGITVQTDDSEYRLHARAVVVASPLRVANENITFLPSLPDEQQTIMRSAATWMAAQAKAVLIYRQAFWREAGLSGRIASQVGPLVEVHDHSGDDGTPAALFGFIGISAQERAVNREQLVDAIVSQMVRCFGNEAAQPESVLIEDWALNEFVCAKRDLDGMAQHPGVLPKLIRQSAWAGRLYFAVAETSANSPGLIDGALDAGNQTAESLSAFFRSSYF